jgi:cellulose biosynthesis protein BcsQ
VAETNPGLHLLGYLLTMVARRSLHRAYEELLRKSHGENVFTVTIPDAAVFTEAIPKRLPLSHYKPKNAAARSIEALTSEMRARIAALTNQHREVA